MTTTVTTAADLRKLVSTWVDRSFNFIDLQNAEMVFNNLLYDYIESNQTNKTANCFLLEYNYILEYMESDYDNPLDFAKDHYEDEYTEYTDSDNYPIWGTLFEFRHEPSHDTIEAAREAGIIVISKSDNYNTMLFFTGCGYSFYGAHWIPMYLGLSWVDRTLYDDIDYSGE